ncbi:MAG: histidine phosphatase family protein [Alphaproteobacteria bacterium]|nr:histidine phosphatase family protein [Alphaproteobacteria bacterium]
MITLLLLRHFKSSHSDPGVADHDRTLNARGRAAGSAMARRLRDLPIRPGLVLCSTARRTCESLEAVRAALPANAVVRHDPTLYLGGAGAILRQIRTHGGHHTAVLVIAHNPDVHELGLSLAADGDRTAMVHMRSKYPTGGLAILSAEDRTWADLGPRSLRLQAFVRPEDLEPQAHGS